MTKKINPLGKCLALTFFWPNSLQNFGNFFYFVNKYLFIYLLFHHFLVKLMSFKKKYFVNQFTFFIFSKLFLIRFSNLSFDYFWLAFLNDFFWKFWKSNFLFLPLKVFYFLTKNFYLSADFLWDYLNYLTKNFCFSPKKTFNLLILFLTKNYFHLSLFKSKKGFKIKRFVGFKIKLIGRFESSKNAMSKNIIYKFGKINSSNLQINTNFLTYTFFTKLGVSNLKIWIFYTSSFRN